MEFRYKVVDDKITEIEILRNNIKVIIPADYIDFSLRNQIKELLEKLWSCGLKLERLTVAPIEEYEVEKSKPIIEFSKLLIEAERRGKRMKKFILLLNDRWKTKGEIDRALNVIGNPQAIAGIIAGITMNAKKAGLISKNEDSSRIIEKVYDGAIRQNKYKLTELGMKIKETLIYLQKRE